MIRFTLSMLSFLFLTFLGLIVCTALIQVAETGWFRPEEVLQISGFIFAFLAGVFMVSVGIMVAIDCALSILDFILDRSPWRSMF